MWWPCLRLCLVICIVTKYQLKWVFVTGSDDEYRLLQDLKSEYDPVERPVQNHSEPVDVRLRILLQQLVDVDEKNQVLTLVIWTQFSWHDYKMKWSPEEYGGIQDVRFPSASKLDLFIDDKDLEGDNQMDLSYYVPNGEWELIATPARRISSTFGNESYVELYFYLHIERKTIYYGMNWIQCSRLYYAFGMWRKITLQTTNLLSVTVFLGMVADVTPPTSTSVPIIAAFFSISMIILGSSIIFTLLIINVHFRSPRTHKMSPWVRTAFLEWLPWLLLMNRPGKQFKKPKKQSTATRSGDSYSLSRRERSTIRRREKGALSRQSESEASRMGRVDSVNSTIIGPTKTNQRQFAMDPEKQTLLMEATAAVRYQRIDEKLENMQFCSDAVTLELLRNTLHELSDYLRLSQTKMDEEEEEEEAKADWRFMAMALDRACLFFYAFLSAILPVWFWGAYKT